MRETSLLGMVAIVGTMRAEMHHANHTALDRAGRIVRDEARRVLGTYDYNWPPLAPATLAHKTADTPGIETGEMHDSVQYRADHVSAEIGSDLDKAIWFELGTVNQPPRSFLAGALQHEARHVVDTIGRVIVAHLEGRPIPGTNILPIP